MSKKSCSHGNYKSEKSKEKIPGPVSGTVLKFRFSSFRNAEFENLVNWAF